MEIIIYNNKLLWRKKSSISQRWYNDGNGGKTIRGQAGYGAEVEKLEDKEN